MKRCKHHAVICTAILLSASMLLGTFGCGAQTSTTTQEQNGSAAVASSQASGSGAWVDANGSAVPTGGLDETQSTEESEQETVDPRQELLDSLPEGDKYIALTFDDGPTGNDNGLTVELLDALKERGVHATFFLCGYRVKDYNSMMDRYLAEGHEVGNHTMDHEILTNLSSGVYDQISSNNKLIKKYMGERPTLLRPPGGAYNDEVKSIAKKLKQPIILWDLDTLDWKTRNAESVKNAILDSAEDGDIVLEHDLYDTTVEGVLDAIDELQDEGFVFVTVSELATIKGVELKPGHVYTDFRDKTINGED